MVIYRYRNKKTANYRNMISEKKRRKKTDKLRHETRLNLSYIRNTRDSKESERYSKKTRLWNTPVGRCTETLPRDLRIYVLVHLCIYPGHLDLALERSQPVNVEQKCTDASHNKT